MYNVTTQHSTANNVTTQHSTMTTQNTIYNVTIQHSTHDNTEHRTWKAINFTIGQLVPKNNELFAYHE